MANFLVRFGLMLLASAAVMLGCVSEFQAVDASAIAWGFGFAVTSVTGLFAPRAATTGELPLPALLWSSGSALLTLVVAWGLVAPIPAFALAAVVWLVSLALQSALALACTLWRQNDPGKVRLGLTATFVMLSFAPIWLGPLAQSLGSQSGWPAAIVVWSPASHLASAVHCDYLRVVWFYTHTPIGGLRFDYPPPWTIIATYSAVAGLLWGALQLATRRPNTVLLDLQTVRS